jgi:DNA-binding winged helix-turn-helix (wHTH) protein/TolB-like protein/lipopolysaccharide biosynthesis regulator YciM
MRQPSTHFYEFGPFRLARDERVLLRNGELMALTPKVFDTLLVLVENAGHIIDKDELMRQVWPDSFVDEGTLTRNISRLRSVLEADPTVHDYIETVPRRGYRFVAPVREVWEENAVAELLSPPETEKKELPAPVVAASVSPRWPPKRQVWALSVTLLGIAIALAYVLTRRPSSSTGSPIEVKSIAVLPFRPLNSDGGDEYLGLGLADTLITKLGALRQLIVRPTSAVRKYDSPTQDPLVAGREQQVEAVLDASLQRNGERIRVTVRLLKVGDGATLWSYQCDEQYCADVFVMQDVISERVAAALTRKLTGEEQRRLRKHYTENRVAYELYLKGRYFINKSWSGEVGKGIEAFQQAIATDPNYALAHAGLADAYVRLVRSGATTLETMPKAKAAALKALELDDSLAEAHVALALVKMYFDWDWAGAEKAYQRALELNPNNADVHQWYGRYLSVLGRFDAAEAELKRALQLDPLSPVINLGLGEALYYARQYDQAIKQFVATLELDSNYPFARWLMGKAFMQKANYPEAIAVIQKEVAGNGGRHPALLSVLGRAYALSGRRDEAQQLLTELTERAVRSGVNVAPLYLALGENEQAFALLEKESERRGIRTILLRVEPEFDSVRSDPRFQDLLRRVGLTQ